MKLGLLIVVVIYLKKQKQKTTKGYIDYDSFSILCNDMRSNISSLAISITNYSVTYIYI